MRSKPQNIAVVIPCFRVKSQLLNTILKIGPEVNMIFVVDDCCPEYSGKYIQEICTDPRVKYIFNEKNLGVGGAVIAGYLEAIADGADILVKVDGDNQMDPTLIPLFVDPIIRGEADYTKGNRFYDLESLSSMPAIRIFGNAILSFMTKLSSGYWNIFDPTNGFTALHSSVARRLPYSKISKRYFFESDMLFRLNLLRAVTVDIPMDSKYGDEISNLKISKIFSEFLYKHTQNLLKRILYNYFLRDFSLASIELFFGLSFLIFGIIYGGYHWYHANQVQINAPTGTVVLSAMTTLLGMQLLLGFLAYDIRSVPTKCINKLLE